MKSQKENIRTALKGGHRITPFDALQWFGCARLAARIQELRREGMDIVTEMKHNRASAEGKKSFACYSMRRE
tara:strand:- start:142 stop:357 length:216 start_codon:yes stop_codon:yes gene_type:complete